MFGSLTIPSACACAAAVCAVALGQDAADSAAALQQRMQQMQEQIEALKKQNEVQSGEIQQLRTERGEQWLTEQRAAQIREVVTDVLADSVTRASLQESGAVAGWDKGFFLASDDGNFKLWIRGQIQARGSYNRVPAAATTTGSHQSSNEYGFELRRVKLFFMGNIVDPSWQYQVEVSFERNGAVAGSNQVVLENAYVQKVFDGGVFVRAGQWLSEFNQEEMVSSSAQQFAERSIVNQYFSVKWVQGVELGITQEWWNMWLSFNDGGGNRNIQVIQTSNLVEWAATLRSEFKLAGTWAQQRAYQGWIGSEFGAMLGAGVNWQRGTGVQGIRNAISNGTIPGAPGGGEQASLLTYTADLGLRGSGWSANVEGFGNVLYGFAPTAVLPTQPTSLGVVVQGGVFLSEQLELIARYEGLWVSSGIANATVPNALNNQTLNIVTAGFNYYFSKNQCKLTFDAGYAFNAVRFSSGLYGQGLSEADWRSTLNAATASGGGEGEVVVRTQMQLMF